MINNPFRNTPSVKLQQDVENWGKSKFKPKKFGESSENTIKKLIDDTDCNYPSNKILNIKESRFYKNKETYKFNEVARDAKPENATPWKKYKDEIILKQREEEQVSQQTNLKSTEAKIVMKQREINYRKSLVAQKKQEPIEWETFCDEENDHQNSDQSRKVKNKDLRSNQQTKNFEKKQFEKKPQNTQKELNSESKPLVKKNASNSVLEANTTKEFISKELLDNFDSKKLNYYQNNKLRGVITKLTIMRSSYSLQGVVKDLKNKKLKKEKLNKK